MRESLPEFEEDVLEEEYDDESVVHYFCRLTFGQFFTLVVFLFLAVFVAFYLGARYGNNYLRIGNHEPVISRPTVTTIGTPPPVRVAPAALTPEQREAIEDDELKQLARQALHREQSRVLEKKVHTLIEAGSPINEANTGIPVERSARPQLTEPPIVRAGSERPSTRPLPPEPSIDVEPVTEVNGASGLPYAIQVGSYRDVSEASYQVNHWKSKGHQAYLQEADIPGKGHWYRVRVGAFTTRNEAARYVDRIKSTDAVDAIVVPTN